MTEKDLAISLGVSREQIKGIRDNCIEGRHFTRKESKKPRHLWEISWTDEGVKYVMDSIGLDHKQEAPAPVGDKRGTVYSKFMNVRCLGVLIDGKQETVLCKDNRKFGIGMPVSVRWDGSRWVVSRHPRYAGKY